MSLRSTLAVVAVLVFVAPGSARTDAQVADPPALYVTLPMTNGFADATDALVQALGVVREALGAVDTVHLVDRPEDNDAVLTVLGRGTGHAELTATLKELDPNFSAPSVMIGTNERYIHAMLSVGSCDGAASEGTSSSCYRRVFVGLGLADRSASNGAKKPAANTWEACASALARDVRAWFGQNAGRLLDRRGKT
jgi:hypothetical protein